MSSKRPAEPAAGQYDSNSNRLMSSQSRRNEQQQELILAELKRLSVLEPNSSVPDDIISSLIATLQPWQAAQVWKQAWGSRTQRSFCDLYRLDPSKFSKWLDNKRQSSQIYKSVTHYLQSQFSRQSKPAPDPLASSTSLNTSSRTSSRNAPPPSQFKSFQSATPHTTPVPRSDHPPPSSSIHFPSAPSSAVPQRDSGDLTLSDETENMARYRNAYACLFRSLERKLRCVHSCQCCATRIFTHRLISVCTAHLLQLLVRVRLY